MTAQWFVEVGETAEFTKTVTETDLDKIVDNLLKDVDVPLFERD